MQSTTIIVLVFQRAMAAFVLSLFWRVLQICRGEGQEFMRVHTGKTVIAALAVLALSLTCVPAAHADSMSFSLTSNNLGWARTWAQCSSPTLPPIRSRSQSR